MRGRICSTSRGVNALLHERPQAGVVGRVQVEHVSLQRLEHACGTTAGGPPAAGVRAFRLSLTNRSSLRTAADIVVAGDEPGGLAASAG